MRKQYNHAFDLKGTPTWNCMREKHMHELTMTMLGFDESIFTGVVALRPGAKQSTFDRVYAL
jgi:hypothetical protein